MIHKPDQYESFYDFVRRIKGLMSLSSHTFGAYKQCVYKGIHFTVSKDSNVDDIATIYDLKKEVQRLKEE